VLFEKLKLDPKAKKTKTGQYQTGEDVLQYLAFEHDIAKRLMEYREYSKLKSTYVEALPLMVNKQTGRIHTSYNQAVAATGRLSSNNPNLQNIPIRTERGREVRKAFVPRSEGYTFLSADYSQIELRIIAALAKDETMLQAFRDKLDIHTATAAKVFNVDIEDVNKDMRRKAKSVNFGIIYGISAFGLAGQLGISRGEAKIIIDTYFEQFPSIKNYMHENIQFARTHGYAQTILGRRRYLRDINSANAVVRGFAERNAINAPIQGSAADMIKVAMINIYDELVKRNMKSKMILQVHDELVFDAHKSELEELKAMVYEKMVTAIPMDVIIEAEMGTGDNWLAAH
jgi:DNA polymerase-1